MRARTLVPFVLVLLIAVFVPSATAKAEPKFFENVVVEDTDGDFQTNGALDIVGVHISEKYQYDSDKQQGQDTLTLRIQVRKLSDIQCTTVIRYDVAFKVDGAAKNFYAGVTTLSPSDRNACALVGADSSGNVSVRGSEESVYLILGRDQVGAPVGSVLSGFYATSAIMTQAQKIPGDVAPMDNTNAPSDTAPTTGLKTYTSVGTYPFITAIPTTPIQQYSVGGSEVEYNFDFVTHPDLKDENIRVRFDFPTGWTISPSQGRTGNDPEGQLTASNGGLPRAFSFTLSSSGAASEGDQVSVIMEVITDSGGHLLIPTTTTVSGAKIEDPSLNFTLLTPGPFKSGETSPVRFKVANESGPIAAVVSVDLILKDKRVSTTALTLADGVYSGTVNFPSEGTYTLDAYLSSLKPSPHQSFVVKAEDGGFAPGLPVWSLVVLLGGIALWRRRQ
jgi:hypothetical protein